MQQHCKWGGGLPLALQNVKRNRNERNGKTSRGRSQVELNALKVDQLFSKLLSLHKIRDRRIDSTLWMRFREASTWVPELIQSFERRYRCDLHWAFRSHTCILSQPTHKREMDKGLNLSEDVAFRDDTVFKINFTCRGSTNPKLGSGKRVQGARTLSSFFPILIPGLSPLTINAVIP